MAEVAQRAGTTRTTLYKMFGSRRELGRALVAREAARVLEDIDRAMGSCPGPAEGLLAAFDAFLRAADENALIGALLRGEASELVARPVIEDSALMSRAARLLSQMIASAWPLTDGADAVLLGEVFVRLAASHATRRGAHEHGLSPAAPLVPYIEGAIPAASRPQELGDRGSAASRAGSARTTLAATVT